MAACIKSEGYRCEFIDSVIDIFYCKKCSLVARNITITSCCGESYCHACIADIHQQGKPCPECGEEGFNTYDQLKYQRRIKALKAYCSMKERGCGWSGKLEQLDNHLDPDQDNCQFVDTKCPLDCYLSIPKNKVNKHVAEECTKRPYVCQHCNFKATYHEVVNTHLPECKYVPLDCPNRCGVTCEREDMEDHMKICRLEEIQCEFYNIGCKECFNREDQEEHMRQNSQKHLTLTASFAVQTKERLEKKISEQEKKLKEAEEKEQHQKHLNDLFRKKLLEHGKKLKETEEKWKKKMEEQEQKLKEQDRKLIKQELEIKTLNAKHKGEVEKKLREQKKMSTELFLGLFSWCCKADNIKFQSCDLNYYIDDSDFPSLNDTLPRLFEECPICFALYYEMIRMPGCTDSMCKQCFKENLTVVVRNQEVKYYNCPICSMPNMADREAAKNYLQSLVPLAMEHLDPDIYQWMQNKLTDFYLMTHPDFYWCASCPSGFLFTADAPRVPQGITCPHCRNKMCHMCKKPWEDQHESNSCEKFAWWKWDNNPDARKRGLAAYINANGIECPACHMRYDLAKGGCMHFTCTHCSNEFCSGCSLSIKKGMQCGKFEFCKKLGLHAHHPRDCLYYLGDFDVKELQDFLSMNKVEFDVEPPKEQVDAARAKNEEEGNADAEVADMALHCCVMLQKEKPKGLHNEECGKKVTAGHAGLCVTHYKEYLVDKINKNKLDPVSMYQLYQIKRILEREDMKVPEIDDENVGEEEETEEQYRERLIEHVKRVLPLLRQQEEVGGVDLEALPAQDALLVVMKIFRSI